MESGSESPKRVQRNGSCLVTPLPSSTRRQHSPRPFPQRCPPLPCVTMFFASVPPNALVLTCAMQKATLPAAPPTQHALPSIIPAHPPLAFTPAPPRAPLLRTSYCCAPHTKASSAGTRRKRRTVFLLTWCLPYGAGALSLAAIPLQPDAARLPYSRSTFSYAQCQAAMPLLTVRTPHRREGPCHPPQPPSVPSLPHPPALLRRPLLPTGQLPAYTSACVLLPPMHA